MIFHWIRKLTSANGNFIFSLYNRYQKRRELRMAFNKSGSPMTFTLIQQCKCGSTSQLTIQGGKTICESCLNENQLQTKNN